MARRTSELNGVGRAWPLVVFVFCRGGLRSHGGANIAIAPPTHPRAPPGGTPHPPSVPPRPARARASAAMEGGVAAAEPAAAAAAAAATLPAPPPGAFRARIYELLDDGSWKDLATGFATAEQQRPAVAAGAGATGGGGGGGGGGSAPPAVPVLLVREAPDHASPVLFEVPVLHAHVYKRQQGACRRPPARPPPASHCWEFTGQDTHVNVNSTLPNPDTL